MKEITITLPDHVYDAHRKLYKQVLVDIDTTEDEHSFEDHLAVSLTHTVDEHNSFFEKDLINLYNLVEKSMMEILDKRLDTILFKALMRYLHTQGVNK